jgi:hypothetical protein
VDIPRTTRTYALEDLTDVGLLAAKTIGWASKTTDKVQSQKLRYELPLDVMDLVVLAGF